MTLVTRSNFQTVLRRLETTQVLAVDTETTGLRSYQHDRAFSFILGDDQEQFYFNCIPYPEISKEENVLCTLDESHVKLLISRVLARPNKCFFMQNAKFDMKMFGQVGHTVWPSVVHCTMAIHRILQNNLRSYSMENLAQFVNMEKSKDVEKYLEDHDCYRRKNNEGKESKNWLYHKAPLSLIVDYACRDVQITYALGMFQCHNIKLLDGLRPDRTKPQWDIALTERELTKTLFAMEHAGVRIDIPFCREALTHEKSRIVSAEKSYREHSGSDFVDSGKSISETFAKYGITLPTTDKGNASSDSDALAAIEHPLAKIILEIRDAAKRSGTYFTNFIQLADRHARIHCDFRQSGTGTGRMSCMDPNLQNLPKNDEDETVVELYPVRRAFVPSDDEHCLFAPDYEQMEYRMMLEYAQQMDLIEEILGGKDVHQATADLLGVKRKHAKTINFMLLYGGGIQKLADALKCSFEEARAHRTAYFARLPKVGAFVDRVKATIRARGYIVGYFGRRSYMLRNEDYKAPNYLIQGSCADVVKIAMNGVQKRLQGTKSKLIMQVHDELVIDLHKSDLGVCPDICEMMTKAFPFNFIPLTVEPSYSWRSLADKEKGYPIASVAN